MNHEFKVGDVVIGIKNDPDLPTLDILGKIGKVIGVNSRDTTYPYEVIFKEQIDFSVDRENLRANRCIFNSDEIKLITKLKLEALLKD